MALARSVVYSLDPSTHIVTNLNSEVLELDPFLSYTIADYLEDRASEGLSLRSVRGNAYRFSDGHVEVLIQQVERLRRKDLRGMLPCMN